MPVCLTQVCVCVYVYLHTSAYVHMCMPAHTLTISRTHQHAHIHKQALTTSVSTLPRLRRYLCTRTHARTHTRTRTNTHSTRIHLPTYHTRVRTHLAFPLSSLHVKLHAHVFDTLPDAHKVIVETEGEYAALMAGKVDADGLSLK